MLLKSIEDLHGEQGVKNLIKIKDSEKNNSLMIAVQSGNVESAKVISFYLIQMETNGKDQVKIISAILKICFCSR